MNKNLILLITIAFIVSCGSKQMKPVEYINYVKEKDNGYLKTFENPEYKIDNMLLTSTYYALTQLEPKLVNDKVLDSINKDMQNETLFNMKFYLKNKNEEFTNYINYKMNNDIYLIVKQDSFKCKTYIPEPPNGVQPYINILLGFNCPQSQNMALLIKKKNNSPLIENIVMEYDVQDNIKIITQ